MAIQAFEAATGILRDMYKGFIAQVNAEQSPLLKIIQPKSDKVFGQQVKFSAQLENPQGVASRFNANQALPAAVPGKYIELVVGTGRVYGVLEFDSKMLKAAGQNKEGKNAYVNYLENEMKGLKNTHIFEMSRQLFGKKTGFISACGTTSASLTLVLAATANMEYFVEGQHIDIVGNAGHASPGVAIANGSDRVIQSVDIDLKKIVLDSAGGVVTTDSTHSITRQGAYNAEMTGLEAIISATEDIYGITTATQRRWKAYVNSVSTVLSEKAIAKTALAAKIRGGVYTDLIVSHPDKMQQYWYLLTGTKTFDTANKTVACEELGTGYYKITIMVEGHKMEWVGDPHCPAGVIYGLRKEDIGIQHLGNPEFMDIAGEILLPNIYGTSGTPTVKAVLEYYPEFICTRRNSHWVMTTVTDISGW